MIVVYFVARWLTCLTNGNRTKSDIILTEMQTNKDTRKEDLLKELASDYANYLVVDSNDEVRVNITF